MFFRRERPKVLSFQERVDDLRHAGFATQPLSDGRIKIDKHGCGAIIRETGAGHSKIEKVGVLIGDEIAVLLSGGFQMFLETPAGKRFPATASQLKALHSFEEDLKETLDVASLYNTSLGTTSKKHLYDRVQSRDQGRTVRPWDRKSISPQ